MKGDFSRLTGLKAMRKHYNGVLKQQGRVQLDSDWNELISIISHQRKTRTIDTIGQCGAPIHNSGFQIFHSGAGLQDLLIATGRFYAGGLLCETSPSSKLLINDIKANGEIAVDDIKIDGVLLETNQWVQIITKEHPEGIIGQLTAVGSGLLKINSNISSLVGDQHPYLRKLILFSEQTDFPQPTTYNPVAGQTDLLYLDVWERHITSIESPDLREVALGGPDTDTRSRVIAQVKVLPNVGNVNCEDKIDIWNEFIKVPNGRLTTSLGKPTDPPDPCQLGESGGFLGLENQLYRVEIHAINAAGIASFKWSRDNAAFAYGVKEFFDDGAGVFNKISLKQNGKDDILKIKQQDWIEISGEETDLDVGKAGTLVKVTKVEGTVLTLDGDVSAHINEAFPKVRRWESKGQNLSATTDIVAGTEIDLEDGIKLEFSGTEFKAGDYWVFSARTLTGEIEILDKEPPLGIKHHYCKLALVTGKADGNVDIEDCRPEFPPLTELPDTGGCCTVTVGKDADFQDIQLAIDSLNGGPGEVCIKPGVYVIEKPILVEGNDITIKGCEGTPIIINNGQEFSGKIFIVQNSRDIHIHDLWCLSLTDSRVVEVSNCVFFKLNNCLLVGGGGERRDVSGVITFLGITIETRVYDNLILGIIGIRYDEKEDQQLKQQLNIHLNARVEKNNLFVLEHGLFQNKEVFMLGFDMKENLVLGINMGLMSKAFFPKSLADSAEASKMFNPGDLKKAKTARARDKGAVYESINKDDTTPANDLHARMKMDAAGVKAEANIKTDAVAIALAGDHPTSQPVIALRGILIDANFTDNIVIGNAGILLSQALEFTIDNNLILVQQEGISLGSFEGITIKNNFIFSGKRAIDCFGKIIFGLTISNNRIFSREDGVLFSLQRENKFQMAYNVQMDRNIIIATTVGIGFIDPAILLFDLTIVDNSIMACKRAGILLDAESEQGLQSILGNAISLQRVIQRNSITVTGTGIEIDLPDCKILDNDINIGAGGETLLSRGIVIKSSNSIVSNNSIQGITNIETEKFSLGGIYLDLSFDNIEDKDKGKDKDQDENSQIQLRHNKISGGAGNGIEIASNINGLTIESNEIFNMGLNGIAVQEKVEFVNNLSIINNRIQNCHQLLNMEGSQKFWWRFAGIVLTKTQKTQIRGNVICDNGKALSENVKDISIGGFFATTIKEIIISDNQFLNNGVLGQITTSQAVIHVPITVYTSISPAIQEELNSDIQIMNNKVKSSVAPALILGSLYRIVFNKFALFLGADSKAIITGNHFESSLAGLIIDLQISSCIFSSNYIQCSTSDFSTSFGVGIYIVVNGNMANEAIKEQAGYQQQLSNNLIF